MTTEIDGIDEGRVDDGEPHIIDVVFYLRFAKLYLDNHSYGDAESGRAFPESNLYIGEHLEIIPWPKRHSAMDKALASHAGDQGSDPKIFGALILWATPAVCTLSPNGSE